MASNRKKLTEEQKAHFREAMRKTKMERYGDPFYNNMQKCKQTKLDRYGDCNYNNMQKNKETCLEQYGFEHHNQNPEIRKKISDSKRSSETKEKYSNTLLKKYGCTNINLVPEIADKRKNTLMERYGCESPLQNESIREKKFATQRKNKTWNTSKSEEAFYIKLCDMYGQNDVIRQYSEKRYPFRCDFYIKSKDLFIELNLHWTHGTREFDPADKECLEKLRLWEQKATVSKFYKIAIRVWTELDVLKKKYAIENNLNYEVIY